MTIYLDVDGVLADFFSAACKAHGWDRNDNKLHTWNFFEPMGMTADEFWKPLDNYEFWINVEELPWAGRIVNAMNSKGTVVFCSTPSSSSDAHKAKIDWIRSRSWYSGQEILLMGHKERLAGKNSALVDDNDRNTHAFEKAGGWAVLVPQPWNRFGVFPSDGDIGIICETIFDDTGEVKHVDPDTGAIKGSKTARFDLIPAGPLWELAEHYGRGCRKYSARNWEGGYSWSLSFAAALRHLWQFWRGEDMDAETGTKHVISAAWHCFAMAEFMETHPEKDNRVRRGTISPEDSLAHNQKVAGSNPAPATKA